MTTFFKSRLLITAPLLLCCLIVSSSSFGQQSSEQFIPIGQSPGVSGKLSYIGKITEVNKSENTLVVENDQGTKTIKVTSATRFWFDRSKNKLSNLTANYSDCEAGQLVEVKHDRKNKDIADWIKIES